MPLFSPRWNALAREAGIASHSISSGLEALRKANYADKGLYNHAFFGLSIGLERLLKLIVLIDFAILNGGTYPDDAYFRKLGHNIQLLYSEARIVHGRLSNPRGRYEIPSSGLESDIIAFLARFATSARYYNLNFLAGKSQPPQTMDPIAEWATNIGSQILKKHYSKAMRERDRRNAAMIGAMMEGVSSVRHLSEEGTILDTVEDASLRTGENQIMQKYGTFYCAKIVRLPYMILYDLEYAAHAVHLDDVPALHEFFFPFLNEDAYLKSRKTFPARG
jgi:hypothetical protein